MTLNPEYFRTSSWPHKRASLPPPSPCGSSIRYEPYQEDHLSHVANWLDTQPDHFSFAPSIVSPKPQSHNRKKTSVTELCDTPVAKITETDKSPWYGRLATDVSELLRLKVPPTHSGSPPTEYLSSPLQNFPDKPTLANCNQRSEDRPQAPSVIQHWWQSRPGSAPLAVPPQYMNATDLCKVLPKRIPTSHQPDSVRFEIEQERPSTYCPIVSSTLRSEGDFPRSVVKVDRRVDAQVYKERARAPSTDGFNDVNRSRGTSIPSGPESPRTVFHNTEQPRCQRLDQRPDTAPGALEGTILGLEPGPYKPLDVFPICKPSHRDPSNKSAVTKLKFPLNPMNFSHALSPRQLVAGAGIPKHPRSDSIPSLDPGSPSGPPHYPPSCKAPLSGTRLDLFKTQNKVPPPGSLVSPKCSDSLATASQSSLGTKTPRSPDSTTSLHDFRTPSSPPRVQSPADVKCSPLDPTLDAYIEMSPYCIATQNVWRSRLNPNSETSKPLVKRRTYSQLSAVRRGKR